ncbi:MAG: ATP-dependent DNA helicase RecG [Solirubrobacterales bacterium]|nr:ATP-dependent DNA helicase RecG [Solirubrobacterales bacterium]
MDPTEFASSRAFEPGALESAPVHYPKPSRVALPLKVPGQKAEQAARSLGLATVADLLEHLPRDRREARTVAELKQGESATVVVEVRSISSRPVRRRGMRPLVEATVGDETGVMKVTFFNQPWLVNRYPAGTRLVLHGKYQARNRFAVQAHALTAEALAGAEAVAHYPATEGLSSTQIHALVEQHAAALGDVIDGLPVSLRLSERLPDRSAALTAAHFPSQEGDLEAARGRLAFDELLLAQLALVRRRRALEESISAPVLDAPPELTARWLSELLPFALTGDQRRALDQIDADLVLNRPMQRLLMGEVGSGKTVVALYALLRAVENGYQGALMAPTETLAEQHFATLQALLPGQAVPIGLLTGSTPASRAGDLRGKLASGELALVVGTHALIEQAVRFARLGVAVVDEQHRFGVRQRAALDAKGAEGRSPHVLHMTATPIPRTLALAAYGDLDFTLLRELPRGRQPIQTFVCSTPAERDRAYGRIKEELRAGRQAFVVCPLVEESELLQARAATVEFERLRAGEFADVEVVLLHGQMPSSAKQRAMATFAAGNAQVLVATSVIEVGIDVPNATVMLVEDADRYGISQLHQLRGRIGRGQHASLCLLFGSKESPRLRALAAHGDGFKLAEIDLELRGEGELIGTRQHGQAAFKVAEFPRDAELLERAALQGRSILETDPRLELPEHALLRDALIQAYGIEAEAPIPA